MTLGDSPRKNPPFYAGSFQRTFHWVRGSLGYIWIQLSWGNSLIRRLFFRELRTGIMSHDVETLNFMGKMLWGMMSFMTFMTSTNSSLDWNQWYPKVPIKCFPSIHLSFVDCLVWKPCVLYSPRAWKYINKVVKPSLIRWPSLHIFIELGTHFHSLAKLKKGWKSTSI